MGPSIAIMAREKYWNIDAIGKESMSDVAGGELTVLQAIARIDEDPDDGPHSESNPCKTGKKSHQSEARYHAEDGYERHKRETKGTRLVGLGVPEDDHSETHEDKCEECSDVGHIRCIADRD